MEEPEETIEETIEEIKILPKEGLREQIISLRRVMKVVAGGKRLSFSVMSVVGDGNGGIGAGLGKANDVAYAISKSVSSAQNNMIRIPLKDSRTIPYTVKGRCCRTQVLLKPAAEGTGLRAGWVVQTMLQLAGVKDIISKLVKPASNPINVVYATMDALKKLIMFEESLKLRRSESTNYTHSQPNT